MENGRQKQPLFADHAEFETITGLSALLLSSSERTKHSTLVLSERQILSASDAEE
jgi:hypothetical protein